MTVYTDKPGHVIMHSVTWDEYTRALEEQGPSRSVRITFDEGRMEIVTTNGFHEWVTRVLGRLLSAYAYANRINISSFGSLTLRRESKQKGLEPDDCYYIQTPRPPLSAGEFDLSLNPPPDLAIEVEMSRGMLPKAPIYAAMGVPELWRYANGRFVPMKLNSAGKYEPIPRSIALPKLSMDALSKFIQVAIEKDELAALDALQEWLASQP